MPTLVIHIKVIFSLFLSHSFVPDAFSAGNIIPVIKDKSDDPGFLDNYRPITLSPIMFKLFENVLLSLHEHLSKDISHQQVSCLCLLYLSVAFDTIDHSILIHRLSSWFGISSNALNWYSSYLSFCSFFVSIEIISPPPFPSPVVLLKVLSLVLYSLISTLLHSVI